MDVLTEHKRQADRPGREARRRGDGRLARSSRSSSATCRPRQNLHGIAGRSSAPGASRVLRPPNPAAGLTRRSDTSPRSSTRARPARLRPFRFPPTDAAGTNRATSLTAQDDRRTQPTPPSRPTWRANSTTHADGSSRTRTSCASRASRHPGPCRRLPRARPSGWPTELTAVGLEHVEVCETGGHPVVYARLAPRRRTRRP